MLDVQQIFGRAGRPQFQDTGEGERATATAQCHLPAVACATHEPCLQSAPPGSCCCNHRASAPSSANATATLPPRPCRHHHHFPRQAGALPQHADAPGAHREPVHCRPGGPPQCRDSAGDGEEGSEGRRESVDTERVAAWSCGFGCLVQIFQAADPASTCLHPPLPAAASQVTNVKEATQWLSYTYLYTRMTQVGHRGGAGGGWEVPGRCARHLQ